MRKPKPRRTNPLTLLEIRERCRIDDETGCWLWSGAMSSRGPRAIGNRTPVVHRPEWNSAGSVLRVVWERHHGTAPAHGQIVWRTCGHERCCRPSHLATGTYQEYGRWVAESGRMAVSAAGRVERRVRAYRLGMTTISPELAAWVRESEQRGCDVAHALDVSQHAISRIRLGRSHLSAASSAFAFCGVAA